MILMRYFFLLCLLFSFKLHGFEKVVLWGHKLHSHTHSYIHNGFYRGFSHLGYPVYWFDDQDHVTDFDFANTLFITEGQVDANIPLREDCIYILHNPRSLKYQQLNPKHIITLQVYTDSVLNYPHLTKVAPCIYHDVPGRCFYMPWATDLLPHEIDAIKMKLPSLHRQQYIWWVGTVGEGKFGNKSELDPFIKACQENGIAFNHNGSCQISLEDNIDMTNSSYLAPAIVGAWQKEVGYIPCRIFKNISYGCLGVTNSLRVYELFEGKIVYNPDTYQLFYDAQERLNKLTLAELYDLMDFVKTKHTYLNRIQTMLDFIDIVQKSNE